MQPSHLVVVLTRLSELPEWREEIIFSSQAICQNATINHEEKTISCDLQLSEGIGFCAPAG